VIAVLGPGGVGGFVAAALARAGEDVTVVAREETAATIAERGIDITSVFIGDFHADVSAVAQIELAGGTLVVATKAGGLAAGLDRVRGEPDLVVPMLNGLDHVNALRERFGDRAVSASIRIESTRHATGQIAQTSPFLRVDMAPRSAAVERFAATLEAAGIPARILDTEPQVMWGKLVRLNAMALTTSAFDLPLGPIRDDPERLAVLRACVDEGAAVAAADGASVDPQFTMGELFDAHPELDTSMHRDLAAGRDTELDAIAGSVMRVAARRGVPTPTIARLAEKISTR
jgi:2-dehydropantoate 2-reductase